MRNLKLEVKPHDIMNTHTKIDLSYESEIYVDI